MHLEKKRTDASVTHCPYSQPIYIIGGARGVTVIVVGNGHDNTSSNPGRDRLHFT